MLVNRPVLSYPHITILSQGYKGDSESYTEWWIFRRLSDVDVRNIIDAYDISSYSGTPGYGYARRPVVRHSASFTVITQSSGLDI